MGVKASNNAYGSLATGITASATTITLGTSQGTRFPELTASDWGYATLSNAANQLEIVKILERSGDSFVVQRGLSGSSFAYLAGDRMDMRPVAQALDDKIGPDALTPYAKLAGGNTFTGVQKIEAQHCKVLALGSVAGATAINLALASTFTMTAIAAAAVTFTGTPPAGVDQTVYLKITNGGGRVTFPVGTKKSKGLEPQLTAAGKDLLAVWYDVEDACYVIGFAFQDYK